MRKVMLRLFSVLCVLLIITGLSSCSDPHPKYTVYIRNGVFHPDGENIKTLTDREEVQIFVDLTEKLSFENGEKYNKKGGGKAAVSIKEGEVVVKSYIIIDDGAVITGGMKYDNDTTELMKEIEKHFE